MRWSRWFECFVPVGASVVLLAITLMILVASMFIGGK